MNKNNNKLKFEIEEKHLDIYTIINKYTYY